jgi:DNA polymerase
MFVGEAPGKNEAKTGKPFCGAAGRILDQLLDHINKKRENIYITNIVKDRPPENRDPTTEEIEIYGPFLNKEIDIIKPKTIATLGRYSMSYIMKLFGIDSSIEPIGVAHGKKFKAKSHYGEIDIVVLYHPCVAIYNPNKINILKDDIEILTEI